LVDGYGIALASYYTYSLGTKCYGVTIVSDQIALTGCDSGIYQFTLNGQTIAYEGEARAGDTVIKSFNFFVN
jgi:hypothetical protein